jgi:Mg2+ and Co2+ transporters
MINKISSPYLTWIHLEKPNQAEVNKIKDEFILNEAVSEDILSPTIRPVCLEFEKYCYIITHFPRISLSNDHKRRHEIDFIIGDKWIITVTYEDINDVINLKEIYDKNIIKNHIYHDASFFYLSIINNLYQICNNKLDQIDIELDNIENLMYKGKERKMVERISFCMRKIIDFEHAINMHDTILKQFKDWGKDKYGKFFKGNVDLVIDELSEMKSRLSFLKQEITQFQITNDSILQHKTADAMKTLTMMSFIIFPLSLVAGIFGMNASNIPIIGHRFDFEIIIGIMIIITISFLIFFKYKKWF